jgi:hypothetical protein
MRWRPFLARAVEQAVRPDGRAHVINHVAPARRSTAVSGRCIPFSPEVRLRLVNLDVAAAELSLRLPAWRSWRRSISHWSDPGICTGVPPAKRWRA